MLVLECFIYILIPACMHFTIRVKYKQLAITRILVPLNALLHVPHHGLHASDHFMTSCRPWQVRARCYFSKKNCAYGDLGTSLSQLKSRIPQENSQQVNCSFFPPQQMSDLLLSPPLPTVCKSSFDGTDSCQP